MAFVVAAGWHVMHLGSLPSSYWKSVWLQVEHRVIAHYPHCLHHRQLHVLLAPRTVLAGTADHCTSTGIRTVLHVTVYRYTVLTVYPTGIVPYTGTKVRYVYMPRYIPLSTFTCTLQYNALKKSFRVFQIGGFQNIEPSLYTCSQR